MQPVVHFIGNFIFLNLNQQYRPGMSDDELYQAARQAWRTAAWRRARVQYAAVVYQGIVRAVYKVQGWQPCLVPGLEGLWEFNRTSRRENFARYVGQPSAPYMPPGAQHVVQYNFTR